MASFELNPSYPFGFHILQANLNVDTFIVAEADVCGSTPCTANVQPWSAQFNYSFTRSNGQRIASVLTTITLTGWAPAPPGANQANYYVAKAHSLVTVPITAPMALGPAEKAFFTLTLLNPDPIHVAYFQFGNECVEMYPYCDPGIPSSIIVPADYYSSQISLSTPISIKLGQSISLTGVLSDVWNKSAIPDQTIFISRFSNCTESSQANTILIGSVITSLNGQYSFVLAPTSVGEVCGLQTYWYGNGYFNRASSIQNNVLIGPAATALSISASQTIGLITNAYRISGNTRGLNGSIGGGLIIVEYAAQGGPASETWNLIGSAKTDSSGNYGVTWIPTGTGDFTVRATFNRTTNQDSQQATTDLNIQSLYIGPNASTIIPPIAAVAGVGLIYIVRLRNKVAYSSREEGPGLNSRGETYPTKNS